MQPRTRLGNDSESGLAGRQGFEPRYHGPEPCVLPLDDLPAGWTNHQSIERLNRASNETPRTRVSREQACELFPKAPDPFRSDGSRKKHDAAIVVDVRAISRKRLHGQVIRRKTGQDAAE
jgi:hypothetical protein